MGLSASKPAASNTYTSEKAPQAPIASEKREDGSSPGAADLLRRLEALSTFDEAPSGALALSSIEPWESAVSNHPSSRLARVVLSKTNYAEALVKPDLVPVDRHIFNLRIPNEASKVTNQQSSGRCWLFATLNVMRLGVMDRYGLSGDFELSQSYLCFYDWLEKSNWCVAHEHSSDEKPILIEDGTGSWSR